MQNQKPELVGFKYYDAVTAIFVAVLLISQTTASKIVAFGPFNFSAGIILFPIGYIFGDVLTEVYGFSRSRRVIWLGFACSALMSVVYWIVGVLPPAVGWENQAAYETVLGVVPRIAVASLIAYWAGEFANSFLMAKMKVWTQGRHLWVRTITSTIVGEGLDTVLVMGIGFYGVLPTSLLLSVMVNIYWAKVLYEILATPLTYVVVGYLKRIEGVDVYDFETDFNPFRFESK